MRREHFEVEVAYEHDGPARDLHAHTFFITGMYTPPMPGRRKGHPDTWTPGEGAAIEDPTLYLLAHDRCRRLPEKMQQAWGEAIMERVYDELAARA